MRQLPLLEGGSFMGEPLVKPKSLPYCAFQEKVQLTEKQKKAPHSGELSMPEGID